MGVKNAVVKRFQSICKKRVITPNMFAVQSDVTPSSVYSMLDKNRRNISIILMKKLCDGLDITLAEFFTSKKFSELEQEIK